MTLVSGDITSGDFTDCLAPHSLLLFPALFLLSISRPSPVSERLNKIVMKCRIEYRAKKSTTHKL